MRWFAVPLLLSAFMTPLVALAPAAHAASYEPGCDARGCTASSPPPKPGSHAAECPDCAGPPLMPTSAELRRLSAQQDWTRASSVARAELISLARNKLGGEAPAAISFLKARFVDAGGRLGYSQVFCGGYVGGYGVPYNFMVLVPIDGTPIHSFGVGPAGAATANWKQSWHALCVAQGVRGPAVRWP